MSLKPTLRIFISSPGDVAEERDKAKQVIADLQRRHEDQVTLIPVLWEDLAIPATASFQEGIDFVLSERHRIDVAVFILWSRLGSPLGASIQKADGSAYRSGTERELDLMLAAFEQSGRKLPLLLAYTRDDSEGFNARLDARTHGEDALEELLRQRRLVKQFIQERFHDEQGRNLRAYHTYNEPVGFAQRLHVHLRGAVDELLGLDPTHALWTGAPYRSLEVFDVQHAPIFCGRDEETCELLQRLREKQEAGCAFVCIVGASGSGKSSLARAGVAATLHQRSFDDGVKEWRTAVFVPGLASGGLFTGLARSLAEALPELRSGVGGLEKIAKCFEEGNCEAAGILMETAFNTAGAKLGGLLRVLLVLDQMEELWTDPSLTPELREKFLRAAEALVQGGSVSVLATLRSDFYPQAQLSEVFLRMKGARGHFDLIPPGTAALQQLIVQPAQRAGLNFERDEHSGRTLDQQILEDASKDPSALPLLQYALAELYERRDEPNRRLSRAAYAAMGGVEGALGKRAAQTFGQLPGESQAALAEVLPLLVSVDIAGEQNAVRRRAPLTELTKTPARSALAEALISARLLSTDDQGGGPVATLTHEALLRRWDEVARWITANRDLLRMRARVEQYHRMWEQSGRDVSRLLPVGLPLEEGRQLLASPVQVLDENAREYVAESYAHQQAQQRRAAKRRMVAFAVLSAMTVLMTIAGVISWRQSQRANTEAERANAANEGNRANLKRASLADLAFALKAWNENMDAERDGGRAVGHGGKSRWHEAVALLTRSLERDPENSYAALLLHDTLRRRTDKHDWPLLVLQHAAPVTSACFSPDGRLMVTTCEDHTARLWDAKTGQPHGGPLQHGEAVLHAEFSPDGSRVVTSSWDHTARVWDTQTGAPVGKSLQHTDVVYKAHFSADGRRIVTASADQSARVWGSTNGMPLSPPMRHAPYLNPLHETRPAIVEDAHFSPDGSKVVTASVDGTAVLWDATSGQRVGQPMKHDEPLHSARFNADGTQVLTAGEDGKARLWDVATGQPLLEPMPLGLEVRQALFSPDGARILTTGHMHVAQLWDAGTAKAAGKPMLGALPGMPQGDSEYDFYQGAGITCGRFSPDGMRIVTAYGGSDGSGYARLWNAATGTALREPFRHDATVEDANYSPDGMRIITASRDHTARVWDAAESSAYAEPLRRADRDAGRISNAVFSADGQKILTSGRQSAQVWSTTTGEPVGEGVVLSTPAATLCFNTAGTQVLTTATDKTARVWDALSGKPLSPPLTLDGDVLSAEFSPDGRRILILCREGRRPQIWDATTYQTQLLSLQASAVYEVMFTSDSSRFFTMTDQGSTFWDLHAAGVGSRGNPPSVAVPGRCVGLSPDGTRAALLQTDESLLLWDVAARKVVGQPMKGIGLGSLAFLHFSEDGRRIAGGGFNSSGLHVWDASTGAQLGETVLYGEDSPVSASFSPDVRLIASSAGSHARITFTETGRDALPVLFDPDGCRDATFSVDGSRILAMGDRGIRFWKADTGRPLEMLRHAVPTDYKLSADRRTLLILGGGVCTRWALPTAEEERGIATISPDILTWARHLAGLRFTEAEEWEVIPDVERLATIEGARLSEGPWAELSKWLAIPSPERTVDFKSSLTQQMAAAIWKASGKSSAPKAH